MSFSIKHEVAVVVDVVVDVVFDVSGFIQQSSPSPQGQLLRPQTREPSQSESLSQSPSPNLQRPLPPSLQHSSLPSFCRLTSSRGEHGRVEFTKIREVFIHEQFEINLQFSKQANF